MAMGVMFTDGVTMVLLCAMTRCDKDADTYHFDGGKSTPVCYQHKRTLETLRLGLVRKYRDR
jgi:hypothetical protein